MKIKEVLEYGKNNLIEKEDGLRLSKMLLKHFLDVNDSYLIINSDKEIELYIEMVYHFLKVQYLPQIFLEQILLTLYQN